MKNKATPRNIKITKAKKLTGKGKYIVKVVNQLHTKLVRRLKDKRNKLIYVCNKYIKDIQNKKL